MASFFAKLPDSFRTREKRPGSLPGATAQVYGPTSTNVYRPARPGRARGHDASGPPALNGSPGGADISKRSPSQNGKDVSMPEQRTTAPSVAAPAGPPILLVEDDRGQSLLVERVFRKAGVANPVRVFHEGNGALAYLGGQESYADRTHFPLPVLILLDLHVPGRSGLELLTWLRQQPNLDRIPVVMLSGSSESDDIDRAFELGANSYLVKPVAFDALLDTVTGLGLPWMILGGDGKGRDG